MNLSPNVVTLFASASETVEQSLTKFVGTRLVGNSNVLSAELVLVVSQALSESFQEAGLEILKALIEQHDCAEDVIERDGRIYRLKDAASQKKFLTRFGELRLSRRYYHDRDGGNGIVPLDECWGMAGRYATQDVVENVLWACGSIVPSEVSESIKRLGLIQISTSCIQDIIRKDGSAMADMLEDEREGVSLREIEVPEESEVLVASLDGANVLLREKGVVRGRKTRRPRKGDRDENGEDRIKNSSYKNAMVGSFSLYKTEEGVVDKASGVEGLRPQRLASVYNARMPQVNAVGFKKEFEWMIEDILEKAGDKEMTKILLADAARPIWKYVRGNPLYDGFRLIVDFFHASEHLSLAAEAIFGKDSAPAWDWFDAWRYKLKYEPGAAEGVLRSMKRYGRTNGLTKSRREDLEKQIGFFARNKEYMNYAEHVANGWPIGSGPVEAACKSIVKARLCQSGMRWSTKGGRSVLALRVVKKSNQWDTVWRKYSANNWKLAA